MGSGESYADFKTYAEESYEDGFEEDREAIPRFGAIAALHRNIESAGGLTQGVFDLAMAGFGDLFDDAEAALREFGRPDLATLVNRARAACEALEAKGFENETRADERAQEELDERWRGLGADTVIDDIGREVMRRTGWSPLVG